MTIELDHISLSVGDFKKAKAFYEAALGPLRMSVLMEFPMDNGEKVIGMGADGKPFLWISGGGKATHTHIAIRAETREQVDAFYKAALATGGSDNGPPGLRPHYHQNYYAAFVHDPEGHNIEAVVHTPAKPARAAKARTASKTAAKKKPAAKKAAAKAKPKAAKAKKKAR